MALIVQEMQRVDASIDIEEVTLTYRYHGLGNADGPFIPEINVALDERSYDFALLRLGEGQTQDEPKGVLVNFVADTIDDKRAPELISAVLRHGALDRGDAQVVLKTSERTARNTLRQLTAAGYLTSASPKTPVWLAFPLDYRERLFPNLFGDGDLPE